MSSSSVSLRQEEEEKKEMTKKKKKCEKEEEEGKEEAKEGGDNERSERDRIPEQEKMKKKVKREFDWRGVPTAHFLLKIAYDGSNYSGIAYQGDDSSVRTVEGCLFDALEKTCLIPSRHTCRFSRCGRTDKGVHAAGNCISLTLRVKDFSKRAYPEENYNYASVLNSVLPGDIRILDYAQVPPHFDARFDCSYRVYKYFFHLDGDLNLQRMQEAAQLFVGSHDFRYFCKIDPRQYQTPRRTLLGFTIELAAPPSPPTRRRKRTAATSTPTSTTTTTIDTSTTTSSSGTGALPSLSPSSSSSSSSSSSCDGGANEESSCISSSINAGRGVASHASCAVATIVGTSFLWHQVRFMMSAIFSVGRGKHDAAFISQLLRQGEEEGRLEREKEEEENKTHGSPRELSQSTRQNSRENEEDDRDEKRDGEERRRRRREEEERECGQGAQEKKEEEGSLCGEKEGRKDERYPDTEERNRERDELDKEEDQGGKEVRETCTSKETTALQASHVTSATCQSIIPRSCERKKRSPSPHSSPSLTSSEPVASIDGKNGASIPPSWLASSSSKEEEEEKDIAKERKKSRRIERRRISPGISPALPDCLVLYACHFEGVEWLSDKQKKMKQTPLSSSSSSSTSCSSSSKSACNPRDTFQRQYRRALERVEVLRCLGGGEEEEER